MTVPRIVGSSDWFPGNHIGGAHVAVAVEVAEQEGTDGSLVGGLGVIEGAHRVIEVVRVQELPRTSTRQIRRAHPHVADEVARGECDGPFAIEHDDDLRERVDDARPQLEPIPDRGRLHLRNGRGSRTMAEEQGTDDQPLAAGTFSGWLVSMRSALRGERDADVPCDGCTACCTSSQFIHIEPDETDTLTHIPQALLFPAPGSLLGHVVLGYDDNGHCPMLIDEKCSIYEHRPRTCRTYDCRVFAASGVAIDDERQVAIARRSRRWRFEFPTVADQVQYDAVHAAARSLEEGNATQRAVRAVEVHEAFMEHDD